MILREALWDFRWLSKPMVRATLQKQLGKYERALDQNKVEPLLFQNYGALLRASGNEKKAEIIYKNGLSGSKYPNHSDILPNYANLLRSECRTSEAFQCCIDTLFIAVGLLTVKILKIMYTTVLIFC